MAEADCPGTTIAVHRGAWPHLPPDCAAMLAPPISVSSLPVVEAADCDPRRKSAANSLPEADAQRRAQRARSRANMPVGRHHRPTR